MPYAICAKRENEMPEAMSYELPPWQAGQSRRATTTGIWGAVFSLIGIMFTIVFAMNWASGNGRAPEVTNLFVLLACPSTVVGFALLTYAGRGAPLRRLIKLNSQGIATVRKLGSFRRTRWIVWDQVRGLILMPAGNDPAYAGTEGTFLLRLERVRGGPVWLAGDDDRGRLRALALDLIRRSKAFRPAFAEDFALTQPAPLVMVEECPRDQIVDRAIQPAGSTAIVETYTDGVMITIPAFGLRQLAHDRPLAVVVVAVGIVVIIAGVAAFSHAAVIPQGLFDPVSFKRSMLTLAPALVLSLAVADALSRRACLAVRDGVLTVRWSIFLFLTRRRSWPCDELEAVRAVSKIGSSDTGRAWRQYLEIQSRGHRNFAQVRLLDWREKDELEWIATILRRSFRPSATAARAKATGDGCEDETA